MMDMNDQRRHARKINTITEERKEAGKQYLFYTKMYVPEYLKYFFHETGGLVQSSIPFSKKKDSENFVFLTAVKQLYKHGLIGEDLYPCVNRILLQKAMMNRDDVMMAIDPNLDLSKIRPPPKR